MDGRKSQGYTYRNGDKIPNLIDGDEWRYSDEYCWYDNDTANKVIYGALYTWSTVDDSRGLAPTGWHIPTETEWITLITYLGGESIAGNKLKEDGTLHWLNPNTGADNSSGFTGLPGGRHYVSDMFSGAYFDGINYSGMWWSSQDFDAAKYAGYMTLDYENSKAIINRFGFKYHAFSVRCIMD